MHKLSVPFAVNSKMFNKEQSLEQLKRVGANRVFLSLDVICFDRTKRAKQLEPLKEAIPFFKNNGIEVGVWLWTFNRKDPENADLDMKKITGFDGKECDDLFCPSSKNYIKDTQELFKDIATFEPNIIMFDDDYRFGCLPSGMGCCCDNHLKIMSEKLGEEIERKDLSNKVFCGGSNKYRDAYLDSLGDSMRNFAKKIREAVDGVDENIRIALCSVMSIWDQDGTNAIEIARLLAGNTKPLLRFIGAPYWAVNKSFGCRLNHTIEIERMESSWCKGTEIETMSEGDSWPRPRYRTPASYQNLFDTALRAAGTTDGILKYMFDYVASANYEPGYAKTHIENEKLYSKIEDIFKNKRDIGVRVYETMDKVRYADFPKDRFIGVEYIENTFFPCAAKLLSDNTVPTTYTEKSKVGIAFGENVRHLPKEAFEGGLIIDITAAKILMKQGVDVGIDEIGEPSCYERIYYNSQKEYTFSRYAKNSAYKIKAKSNAKILAEATSVDGNERYPDTIYYENENGDKFVVFAFDGYAVNEDRYRSYCMQNLLHECYKLLSGNDFSFICTGNPDLYMLVREDEEEVAIGLWNICADKITEPVIKIDRKYKELKCLNGTGKIEGNHIKLSPIYAYENAFVVLKKL